jgi:ribosomal protein S18 acetylase RimI-like enzyme
VGLHGLRTVADARRKGYAQALIAALGTVAVSKGINRSFLQVEEGNLPAVDLYRRLGFQTAWRYHYWRKTT